MKPEVSLSCEKERAIEPKPQSAEFTPLKTSIMKLYCLEKFYISGSQTSRIGQIFNLWDMQLV
jgi:hypothetical protein